MNVRILHPDEWGKLEKVPMEQMAPLVPPEDVKVVAVEEDGELIACVTMYRATHWEGTWIDPKHRNPGVTRALLRGAFEAGAEMGSPWTFVDVDEKRTGEMVQKLGGKLIPTDTYVLRITEDESCHEKPPKQSRRYPEPKTTPNRCSDRSGEEADRWQAH